MRIQARRALLAACLLALPLSGCLGGSTGDTGLLPAPSEGDGEGQGTGPGPAWSFTATDGQDYGRDEPAGNATLLFFMATWCSSCRMLAPSVAQVAQEYGPQGVRTFSLSTDPGDSDAQLEDWKERHAQPWVHGRDEGQRAMAAFDITTQSSVVILDGDGHLVQRWGYGRASVGEMRAALDEALSRAAS